MKTTSFLIPLSLAADPPCVPHVPGHHGLLQGRDGEDQQTGYGADLPSAGKLGGVQPGHPCTGDLVRLGEEGGGGDD